MRLPTLDAHHAGVHDLMVGDEVFGVAPGCLGHTAFAPAETLVRKPRTVAYRDAATAPTVFCTIFTAFAEGLGPSDTVWFPVCHALQGSVNLDPSSGTQF